MRSNSPTPEEMQMATDLIAAVCEERIDADQAAALESLILQHRQIRKLYILTVSLHADLYLQAKLLTNGIPKEPELDQNPEPALSLHDTVIVDAIKITDTKGDAEPEFAPGPVGAVSLQSHSPMRTRMWMRAAVLAIGVSIAAVLVSFYEIRQIRLRNVASVAVRPSTNTAFARLDCSLHPIWDQGFIPADTEHIGPGVLHLKSGLARLEMNSGVMVVVEGPAVVMIENEQHVELTRGRVVVRCPHPATGFTVATAAGEVTDLGTEFGVSVDDEIAQPTSTSVITFDGTVRLSRRDGTSAGATQLLQAGNGCVFTRTRFKNVDQLDSLGSFVRGDDFDNRKAVFDSALALAKNPDVLAYSFFDPSIDQAVSSTGLQGGSKWRAMLGSPRTTAAGNEIAQGVPGWSLLMDGRSEAIIDLDPKSNPRLVGRGLVSRDGFIDADSGVIYLSWLSTAEKSDAAGYGGLSLADGDESVRNEYLFVGKAAPGNACFSCNGWESGRKSITGDDATPLQINGDPGSSVVRPMVVDNKPHLWVVKIEFMPGNDRISLYFDPTGDEPKSPNLLIDSIDIRFDRLRVASANNNRWSFSRVLLGNTFASVVPATGRQR